MRLPAALEALRYPSERHRRFNCSPGVTIVSYYKYHVFMCTNERADGSQCCAQCNAQASRDFLKQRTKELGLTGKGGVRVNNAGCLDRCAEGPVAVVYPEGIWYTYVDNTDLEDILQQHLINGQPVERLRLPD
jgi:(2Fe-2S) ferredoxin